MNNYIKLSLLQDANIVIVEWGVLADVAVIYYNTAVKNAHFVGKALSDLLHSMQVQWYKYIYRYT